MKISDFIVKVIATERLDDRVRGLQLLAENDLAAEGMKWDPEEEEEAPALLPCPACGADAKKEYLFGDDYVHCSDEDCEVCGPSNDPTGAKWNALPRREPGPEAPELPGRVEAIYGYCRGTMIRVKTESNEVLFSARCQTDREEATLREALRRYNAVGRILELIRPPVRSYRGVPQADIVNILDEEGVTR